MPTLADIANEVSHKLSQIEAQASGTSDTATLIKSDTADIKARVDATHDRLDAGLAFLGEGLFAVLEAQRQANAHLATQVDQNEVILGWLAKSSDVLCRQLRTLEQDLAAHHDVLATLRTLEGVLGLVHARERVQYDTTRELEAKLAACGPARSSPPEPCFEPCFEPCRDPRVSTHDPRGQDWDGQWKPPTAVG